MQIDIKKRETERSGERKDRGKGKATRSKVTKCEAANESVTSVSVHNIRSLMLTQVPEKLIPH